MDWAVWDQTYDQDVIEENALNEISCIQVLRVLLTEANTKILELEEDLITLQSQLAWADEAWSEVCSAALREKIHCLDVSIQSLKNTNIQDEHDFGVCLLVHREPAERMHEIVKALIENYFQQKDEQFVNVSVKESSSAGLQHETDLMVEKKKLSNSVSENIRKEEVKEASITPAQRRVIFNSSLKSRERKTSSPVTVKHASSIAKGSSLDSSTTSAGLPNEKKISSKLDSVSNNKLEPHKSGLTPADDCMNWKSSMKTALNRRNHQEPVKDLAAYSSLIFFFFSIDKSSFC